MDDSAAATDYTTNKSTIRHGYERVDRWSGLRHAAASTAQHR